MALIERAGFLATLQQYFDQVKKGEGHCVLLGGEAGIGKSSLVKLFCREKEDECRVLQGMCDALYTPRPLAPLYDIALQINSATLQTGITSNDRSALFAVFINQLITLTGVTIIVFEDVHWADEATLDFIKFFARRITRTRCLFLLTYRDDEVHATHPIKSLPGQLTAGSFSRMQLTPLSKTAVEKLSAEKGYSGQDVYSISGGNPFYVNEILASYSPGVPDNVKDSILSVYARQPAETKQVWNVLSIAPAGFEMDYLEMMEPGYATAVAPSVDAKIVVLKDGRLSFKHELYRRAIEANLSLLAGIHLHKKVLLLLLADFASTGQTQRIIHHAKKAGDDGVVVQYGPLAARQAAQSGGHAEACRLYLTVLQHYKGTNAQTLAGLYEAYAYECYLTNQVKEAIIYQQRLLNILAQQKDVERAGESTRFLSRLYWYDGNRKKAEEYGLKAVDILNTQPVSRAKAMAFSNMSQLKMLSEEPAESTFWGRQAIDMATALADEEVLCHALNNVGTACFESDAMGFNGTTLLQQSLDVALKNGYHEHAARAYTNLASNYVKIKGYHPARQALEAGIHYCEERDLDSWRAYMLSFKARLLLETGQWNEAQAIAEALLKNERQATIVKINALVIAGKITMRRNGAPGALPYLQQAKLMAFEAMELQRLIPAMTALLELEWLTGKEWLTEEDINSTAAMTAQMGIMVENSELATWLLRARKQVLPLPTLFEGYQLQTKAASQKAAAIWAQLGCTYEEALALFEGGENDKRNALTIMQTLGAEAVYQKLKQQLRSAGIKSIPRGARKTTQANKALLTARELDVLRLVKQDMHDKEIAATLFISVKTAGHHISSILFKLDVDSRTKAVREAIRLGVIE